MEETFESKCPKCRKDIEFPTPDVGFWRKFRCPYCSTTFGFGRCEGCTAVTAYGRPSQCDCSVCFRPRFLTRQRSGACKGDPRSGVRMDSFGGRPFTPEARRRGGAPEPLPTQQVEEQLRLIAADARAVGVSRAEVQKAQEEVMRRWDGRGRRPDMRSCASYSPTMGAANALLSPAPLLHSRSSVDKGILNERMFQRYAHHERQVLDTDDLRATTSAHDSQRFQVGQLADATEFLDVLLSLVHDVSVRGCHKPHHCEGDDDLDVDLKTCAPTCAAHSCFAVNQVVQFHCSSCANVSDPIVTSSWVSYTYATALRRLAASARARAKRLTFGTMVYAVSRHERRTCSSERDCSSTAKPVRTLLEPYPPVLAIGLVWEEPNPPVEHIMETLTIVENTIRLDHMFHSEQPPPPKMYRLRGLITYYGEHYTAYFYSESQQSWVVFDDVQVYAMGRDWADILERCRKGHLKPTMLFYEEEVTGG